MASQQRTSGEHLKRRSGRDGKLRTTRFDCDLPDAGKWAWMGEEQRIEAKELPGPGEVARLPDADQVEMSPRSPDDTSSWNGTHQPGWHAYEMATHMLYQLPGLLSIRSLRVRYSPLGGEKRSAASATLLRKRAQRTTNRKLRNVQIERKQSR